MSPENLLKLNKRLIDYVVEQDKEGLGTLFPIEQVVDDGIVSGFCSVDNDVISEIKYKYAPIVINDLTRSTIAGVSPDMALESLLETFYRSINLYRLMSLTDNLVYTPEGFIEENKVDQEIPILELREDDLEDFLIDNQESIKIIFTKVQESDSLSELVDSLKYSEDIILLPVNVEEEIWSGEDSHMVILKKNAPVGMTKILRRLDEEGNIVPLVDVKKEAHGMNRLSIRFEFLPFVQLRSNVYKIKIIP